MIQVDVWRGDKQLTVYAHGHAAYAEVGKDIVCAGVSSLLYAYSLYLTARGKLRDGYAKIESERGGEMLIEIHQLEDKDVVAWEVVRGGLELLAREYPLHIKYVENSMKKEDMTWKM